MPAYVGEILIILALILANGFFSAAEMAIIAARRGRLQQLAEEGDRRAKVALELIRDPSRFLATGQIGITLIGTFTAAFGGASLVGELADWLATLPVPLLALHAHAAALIIVGLSITAATLVFGELVPKRLALHRAEQLSRFVAPFMNRLSRLAWPAVWLMSSATNALLTLVNSETRTGPSVSVDDIEHMIDTGKAEGVVESVEMKVAVEALRLGERTVRDIMRPRIDLDALDADTPAEEVNGAMAMAGFSRLPVYERDLDHIIGFVHIKDLFLQQYLGRPIQLRKMLHPALFGARIDAARPAAGIVSREAQPIGDRARRIRRHGRNGHAGRRAGRIGRRNPRRAPPRKSRTAGRRSDENNWLVDGMLSVADLIERLDIRDVDNGEPRGFSTVSGLVLDGLGRIPVVGDATDWNGLRLEVLAMHGQRIDRILVTRLPDPPCRRLDAEVVKEIEPALGPLPASPQGEGAGRTKKKNSAAHCDRYSFLLSPPCGEDWGGGSVEGRPAMRHYINRPWRRFRRWLLHRLTARTLKYRCPVCGGKIEWGLIMLETDECTTGFSCNLCGWIPPTTV